MATYSSTFPGEFHGRRSHDLKKGSMSDVEGGGPDTGFMHKCFLRVGADLRHVSAAVLACSRLQVSRPHTQYKL